VTLPGILLRLPVPPPPVASLAVVFLSGMGTDTGASNPREPRALVNPTDKVPLHWNKTSPPDEYADFTKECRLQHERILVPTTFNTK